MSVRRRLAAVAAVCLVGGFLAGDRATVFGDDPASTAPPSAPPIAVGVIDKSYNASHGFDFTLPVLNSSEEALRVKEVDLVGLGSQVLETYTPEISPDAWRVLEFQVPADCSTPPPAEISTIRLSVERPSGSDDIDIPLPYDGAAVVLDYHQAFCTRSAPVDRSDLAGVWSLQTAYGPETWAEGTLLMRFATDGTYVWDFAGGRLFSTDPAVWGTYHIRKRRLTFIPEGGLACRPLRDNVSTWRAAVDSQEGGVLTMVWRSGLCFDGDGLWIARRALLDQGLPPVPGGKRDR